MRNPLRESLPAVRSALTVPNVLATVALVASLSGTAYAAKVYTGRDVRDGTITNVDFRNGSLIRWDFTSATRTQLRVKGTTGDAGDRGATGPQGADGEPGLAGANGATGDKGAPAPRAYTFQTVAQHSRILGHDPNPGAMSIAPSECGELVAGPIYSCTKYPRWNYKCGHLGDQDPSSGAAVSRHCRVGATSAPRLSRSNQSLIVTSANPSGGLLDMPFPGTIVLNASATFYTQRWNTGRTRSSVQQRLECQLQLARVENGVAQDPTDVGVPVTVYRSMNPATAARNEYERLLTISATGALHQPAGVYESQMTCRAPDDTGDPNERLEFIEGNMSVLSTRSNGQG